MYVTEATGKYKERLVNQTVRLLCDTCYRFLKPDLRNKVHLLNVYILIKFTMFTSEKPSP